jgi:hypothetical protein
MQPNMPNNTDDGTEAELKDLRGANPFTEINEAIGSGVSRRSFVGTAAMAGASLMSSAALAQSRQQAESGRKGDNASDPGPENNTLLNLHPNSNKPPFTDTGTRALRGTPSTSPRSVLKRVAGPIK